MIHRRSMITLWAFSFYLYRVFPGLCLQFWCSLFTASVVCFRFREYSFFGHSYLTFFQPHGTISISLRGTFDIGWLHLLHFALCSRVQWCWLIDFLPSYDRNYFQKVFSQVPNLYFWGKPLLDRAPPLVLSLFPEFLYWMSNTPYPYPR